MNIGIDIDGTITTPYYWRELFNRLFNKNIQEKDCIHYDLKFLYETSRDLWDEIYGDNLKQFYDSVDIREDALQVLQLLKQQYKCFFVTARSNKEYDMQRTKEYLKQYNLDDIELHMLTGHYKVNKAKELNIDVFIEDSPMNALQLAKNDIKVFLINNNYNQNVQHENIIRVNNWFEIYDKFDKSEIIINGYTAYKNLDGKEIELFNWL